MRNDKVWEMLKILNGIQEAVSSILSSSTKKIKGLQKHCKPFFYAGLPPGYHQKKVPVPSKTTQYLILPRLPPMGQSPMFLYLLFDPGAPRLCAVTSFYGLSFG